MFRICNFRLAHILPFILLAIPAFAAAQAIHETSGIIDMDGERFPPENPGEKAEWIFARYHYDMDLQFGRFHFQRWAADYPKADRQFVLGVNRLTRLQARTTEHVIQPLSVLGKDARNDDIYNYPWLYAEDPGAWVMTPDEAHRIRDYLQRGGFFMLDDSHGTAEWENLKNGLKMIFPDRSIEPLPDEDEINHVVYDLDDRIQIDGTRYIWGRMRYTPDSATAQWFGIRDDKGRLVIAICHNSDVGDAWEWADSPNYPEDQASLSYRIGINYIIYAMTH